MFPKIVLMMTIFTLLSACAAPPAETPAPSITLTATLPPTASQTTIPTPTSTPEPPATPEAEKITFFRSGVIETTMLKKDTITFSLSNGDTITMPKIQMAGVEPGYNVDKLVEKALQWIATNDGVACGVFRQPDSNYKPNNPNDEYSRYWNNFWFIAGIANRGTPIVLPYDDAVPAKNRFEVGVVSVNGLDKGVVLSYKGDDPKHYSVSVFLVNADAESVKAHLKSSEINIPPSLCQ